MPKSKNQSNALVITNHGISVQSDTLKFIPSEVFNDYTSAQKELILNVTELFEEASSNVLEELETDQAFTLDLSQVEAIQDQTIAILDIEKLRVGKVDGGNSVFLTILHSSYSSGVPKDIIIGDGNCMHYLTDAKDVGTLRPNFSLAPAAHLWIESKDESSSIGTISMAPTSTVKVKLRKDEKISYFELNAPFSDPFQQSGEVKINNIYKLIYACEVLKGLANESKQITDFKELKYYIDNKAAADIMLFSLSENYESGIKLISQVEKIAAQNYFRAEGIYDTKTPMDLPQELGALVASFAIGKCETSQEDFNYDYSSLAASIAGVDFYPVEFID